MKTAIIIHGTDGYPEENWFPWLKKEMEMLDYQVSVPQFPTGKDQNPENWFNIFQNYQEKINEETIIIGHSYGASFLLRLLEKLDTKITAAVFVAPSIGILPIKYYDLDKEIVSEPFNWSKIKSHALHHFVFHSEDDPYICIENAEKAAKMLDAKFIKKDKAGHFNTKAGYTKFPELLDEIQNIS